MCGISALIRTGTRADPSVIENLTDLVAHRGPDGRGTVFLSIRDNRAVQAAPSEDWKIALGHRRLSILDLSDAGQQPMRYRDDFWLTFGGEIYNYLEIREELTRLGHTFRSRTDTEVLLASYAEWGTDCFRRFRGMWGLVLVDGKRGLAVLSRDRIGIKPLYVAPSDGTLAVFSEIKQATAIPGARMEPNAKAVATYLLTGFEDSEATFFRNVVQVPAGTYQTIDLRSGDIGRPQPFWFPESIEPSCDDPSDAESRLRSTLLASVAVHLRSDVPVGCSLSGGLDSSAVAACIDDVAPEGSPTLRTFTATFPGFRMDEGPLAGIVADALGADPRFVEPSADRFLEDLDLFLWHNDEPVGSLNQYAAYAVARLTREHGVPVTLNGQGGDEVLSGYWQSYFAYLRNLLSQGRVLSFAAAFAGSLAPGGNRELVTQLPTMIRRYRSRKQPTAEMPLRPAVVESVDAAGPAQLIQGMSWREWRIFEIRRFTLPRLLKWDDRNFMAFSVEGRYPFLDHEVIDLCLSFTPAVLYRRGWTKEPLRGGFDGMLPPRILRRRTKVNFATPQESWLAGPLRPHVEKVLDDDSPAWTYIEPRHARELAERAWSTGERRSEPAQALMRLFLVDRWMRVFGLS